MSVDRKDKKPFPNYKPLTFWRWLAKGDFFLGIGFIIICYLLFGIWMFYPPREALVPFIFIVLFDLTGYLNAKKEEKEMLQRYEDDESRQLPDLMDNEQQETPSAQTALSQHLDTLDALKEMATITAENGMGDEAYKWELKIITILETEYQRRKYEPPR